MSHHWLQQVIVWLPLTRVCSIVAAPHGWSKPDIFWPRKYWKGECEDVLGKGQTNPWATKPLLLQWSTPVLLPHCTESAQKNITEKSLTHSHIYCHMQTELNHSKNKNSPSLTISTQQHCPQAPRSHPYDLHCPVFSALLTSHPPQIPSEQDSAERRCKHERGAHSVLSAITN